MKRNPRWEPIVGDELVLTTVKWRIVTVDHQTRRDGRGFTVLITNSTGSTTRKPVSETTWRRTAERALEVRAAVDTRASA